jgi:type IX secretion system substrate protein
MKKIILTIAAFCFLVTNAFGQEIEWQKTIGGNGGDFPSSIHQTSDGGYIIGGDSDSDISGDKTENSMGGADYWIVKTDSAGNIQWQNTIGGSNDDWLTCLQQTADGGYILGGRSRSNISGDKTENNRDTTLFTSDYWIVKVDAAGNIQWQKTIGGSAADELYSVQQTTDGGYILGGYSVSNISGEKSENIIGSYDYWIVKTDAAGAIQWQNTIGGSNWDQFHCLQQTADGGYILAGHSSSNISGDKTENNIGGPDYWVVKTDASGIIQWQNTIGGSEEDYLDFVQQTTDGGYIIGGYSQSNISGDKTENNMGLVGSADYWIVKIDAAGTIQWQNTIGGIWDDFLHSIRQTADGGYILGGASQSNISGDKTDNSNGYHDYWVIKTDSTGSIQWQKTIGGTNGESAKSIQQITAGEYIIGGSSYSNISGDKAENCKGISGDDFWIVKLTDNYNLITGKLFIDANSNAIRDAGEPPLILNQATETNTNRFAFSQQDGSYKITVLASGNFSVSPAPLNYYNVVPAVRSGNFSGSLQTDSLNDFAYQPTAGSFNDLCVSISPIGLFRAGGDASYLINYENMGTTILNPTVIFFPDNDVTYISSVPVASSVTTDSVVWNFGPIAPFQTGNILVTVHINTGIPIGTLINSSVEIDPVPGDANPVCNYSEWAVFSTGSYDPNAILVDRDTVLTTELSSPPYLNYIIYFQNTGNDTAFNVRVLNNIPQTLDVNSFEFVASSHPMNITYGAHARLMEFTFDNILLPDSNIDEPGSHGFIRYRIKPLSTLVAGDQVKNNAFIYFDFNEPVLTDTAVTEIVLPTGVEEGAAGSSRQQLIVYPNPAGEELIVNSYSLTREKAELKIYDLFGREVYTSTINNQQSTIKINVSGFSKGIYFVEFTSGQQVLRGKFLKD